MKQHDAAARLLTSLNDLDRRVSTLERDDADESSLETTPNPSPAPRAVPSDRPGAAQRLPASPPAAIAAAFFVFGVLPEALGDWPYNAWGKDTRHTTTHSHAPSTLHAVGSRHDVT